MKRVCVSMVLFVFVLCLTASISPAASAVETSGSCGASVRWELDIENGMLTITGTGEMENYVAFGTPWNNSRLSIKSVVISKGVTSVGSCAFLQCENLIHVNIPDTVTVIDWSAFYRCSKLPDVEIPNSVTAIGDRAFSECSALRSVTIPDSVTSVEHSVFAFCSSLTSARISSKLTDIGASMFQGCSKLTSVHIPVGVISIGVGAFQDCSSLTSVHIPNSVTEIANNAFKGCSSLAGLTIPDSVQVIRASVFENCTSLTSVAVSSTLSGVYSKAFLGCDNLTDVYYSGSETEWEKIRIYSDNAPLENARIHYNSLMPDLPVSVLTLSENKMFVLLPESYQSLAARASMFAVQYGDGRMTDIRSGDYAAPGVAIFERELTGNWEMFFLDKETLSPLCPKAGVEAS